MRKREKVGDLQQYMIRFIITIVCILTVSTFLTYTYVHGDIISFAAEPMVFHFDSILVILISGIVGFVPAIISFLLLFVFSVIIDISRSYMVFVYLMATILSFISMRRGWYRKGFLKPFVLAVMQAFLLGDIRLLLSNLTAGMGLSEITMSKWLYSFLGELPECLLGVTICYLFLRKCPNRIRSLTSPGRLYMGDFSDRDIFTQLRSSRLSRIVTTLIVMEGLVLGISAAGFANVLLPSLGEEVFSTVEGNFFQDIRHLYGDQEEGGDIAEELVDEAGAVIDEKLGKEVGEKLLEDEKQTFEGEYQGSGQNPAERRRYKRFVLNQSGLAFDLKLIMLLLNIMIPFTVLSNLVAQHLIVTPIILMSSTIGGFCEVPQEEKPKKLREIRSLPIFSRNEIGDLYRALRQMAANIVSFVDQEREKDRLEAELQIAQKTSENKSGFLSNISHELRTPINAVLGLDEMILRETREEATHRYAVDIQNAGKSLLGLVNDILDSSKLEEGKMELIPTEYDLSSMINDLINMISVKAQDKKLEFHVEVDETMPHVLYGDEIRIKQVILNILTNAVKYTEKGSVTMKIGYRKIDVDFIFLKVSVKDTGIGIREEDMDKLFSRFERIEEDRNKTIEGSGLGMNIVKRLLEMMDSSLEVDSTYGQGSDFHFKVSQRVISWHEIGDITEAYQRTLQGNDAYAAGFTAPEARILVVDDTPLNLTVVKGLLKETQVQITTADSGRAALEAVHNEHFDIIFLDQRMPEMDGIQTFHEMECLTRAGENQSAGAPVIALTANAVSGSREEFLQEGFTDYLSKPIDSRALEQMISTYLPSELVKEADWLPVQPGEVGDHPDVAPGDRFGRQEGFAGGRSGMAAEGRIGGQAGFAGERSGMAPEDRIGGQAGFAGEQSGMAAESRISGRSMLAQERTAGDRLVISVEDGGAMDQSSVIGGGHESPIKGLTAIDYDEAIKNCGSEELLMNVLKDYLEVIPGKIADIKRYLEHDDYDNYTVLVHAMKSSSRLIGATQLSRDAEYLEECGDRARAGSEEAKEEIVRKTPDLLKLYRSYYDKIMPLISEGEDEDLRPEIGQEDLEEALYAIREFVEAFDFDSADGVMDMLKDYRIPRERQEHFQKVKQMLTAVDREALLGLL